MPKVNAQVLGVNFSGAQAATVTQKLTELFERNSRVESHEIQFESMAQNIILGDFLRGILQPVPGTSAERQFESVLEGT